MTEPFPRFSRTFTCFELDDQSSPPLPRRLGLFSPFRTRTRPSRPTVRVPPTEKRRGSKTIKVAGTRDNAFRFFRSFIAQQSNTPKHEVIPSSAFSKQRLGSLEGQEQAEDMPTVDFLRGASRSVGHTSSPLARPAASQDDINFDLVLGPAAANRSRADSSSTISEERPVAAGNGLSVSINLAEPLIFLQGYDHSNTSDRSTAMLRGSLHLKVQKSVKIKAVTLKFRGIASTKWPEGIPPKKVDLEETDTIMSHTWPFFNAQFPMAEGGSGADHVQFAGPGVKPDGSPYKGGSPANSSLNLPMTRTGKDGRLSLQVVQSRSFDKQDSKPTVSVAQKGYRLFQPGDYSYNFELPLDSRIPETIDVDLGFVKYELEASVERAGAFRANLCGSKEVTVIRAPAEGSLEQVEPIAISRTWEDQLHYDIVISGKSFPLGSKIPIAFKLTPLAKVQCHRVKVFLTENIEYFCSGKRVHRMEPTRKVLLYEKRADGTTKSTFPGSTQRVTAGGGIPYDQRDAAARGEPVTPQDPTNLLGRLDQNSNVGPTEMEICVQLPGCQQLTDKDRLNMLHFDTTYTNIQVHHWIKIVMRLSRPDTEDANKRRHFEISIDSPFHILSCRANGANTELPAYSSPDTGPDLSGAADCGCPGAPRRHISPSHVPTLAGLNAPSEPPSDSLAAPGVINRLASRSTSALPIRPSISIPPTAHLAGRPPMANGHVQRPMHMLRRPSFNPPAFDDEQPPPPLTTPPPLYGDIASPTAGHGLADYFSRFNATYEDDETDDESSPSTRGRVNLPLTPGGRVNRSFDLGRRDWPSALTNVGSIGDVGMTPAAGR